VRPLLLELEGFGAFRDRTEVDFEGADQFALVGPTGAGKSTIIDAICFVLYGNVPRYNDHRLVGAAMSMGAAEMRVRLRFEVAGERYVAVRIVRRAGTGKVSTKEARLEREVESSDASTVILAGRESEMREAIDALLGLSFEDFTRCVVLPQGEFARFLHDKPADRQALLIRLLDLGLYQRLQSRASTTASELDHEIRFIDGQLAELGASLADLPSLTAEVDRLVGVRSQVDGAVADIDTLARTGETAAVEQARLGRLLVGIRAIEVPAGLARQAEEAAAITAAVVAADAELDAASFALTAAELAVGELGEPGRWEDVLRLWDRQAKGDGVVEQRAVAVEAAQEGYRIAVEGADRAAGLVGAAREAVAVVERANRAHVLAVDLQPGEPCPVCEQVVGHLPLPSAPPGLSAARADLAAAEQAEKKAAGAAADARVAAATAGQALDQAVALLQDVAAQLADAPDRNAAAANLQRAQAGTAALETARRTDKVCRAAAKQARERQAAAQRGAEALAGTFHAQRDAVGSLDPPAPGGDLAVAWVELHQWADAQRGSVEAEIERAAAAASTARGQLTNRLTALTGAALGSDHRVARDLGELQSLIGVAVDRAERAIAAEQQRRDRSAGLEAERVALGDRRMVASELARLLKADRFQRWLISSTLAELATRASERLRVMSAGQFSLDLSDNGEFAVIDHRAADELRPVRTLSGGETFQASLALALALAEGLAEMSGKARRAMDAIFLDEGFGTLDAESLDVVASTIEELSSADGGRMVGVVTHVPALADRMPVRFRVSRDARTASVVREVS
jgi:DNA repair protein SbcC/Rad50